MKIRELFILNGRFFYDEQKDDNGLLEKEDIYPLIQGKSLLFASHQPNKANTNTKTHISDPVVSMGYPRQAV